MYLSYSQDRMNIQVIYQFEDEHSSDLSISVSKSDVYKLIFYLTIVNKYHVTVTFCWHDSRIYFNNKLALDCSRRYTIANTHLFQGHGKSTSCDLCNCKVWSCCVQQFRRFIYIKTYYLTFDHDIEVKATRNIVQYHLHHATFVPENWNCIVCFCLFVWCLATHQPLWVISVRWY